MVRAALQDHTLPKGWFNMENKKTFGAYICRRRKELGLTQREFADRRFVTESAVSKWERGMSYPDITLRAFFFTFILLNPSFLIFCVWLSVRVCVLSFIRR